MKKIFLKRYILFMTVLTMFFFPAVGCSGDDASKAPTPPQTSDWQLEQQSASVYYMFPTACANGQIFHAFVGLDMNLTSPKYRIDYVEYYWDNELVATSTAAKGYALDLKIDDNNGTEGTRHLFEFITYVVNDNDSDDKHIFKTTASNLPVAEADASAIGVQLLHGNPPKKDYSVIKNGQSIKYSVWQVRGKTFTPRPAKVEVYWDNALVATNSFPDQGYQIEEFAVKGASIGTHNLTFQKYRYNPNTGKYDDSGKDQYTIMVIE